VKAFREWVCSMTNGALVVVSRDHKPSQKRDGLKFVAGPFDSVIEAKEAQNRIAGVQA
jgi:hypothetical protein